MSDSTVPAGALQLLTIGPLLDDLVGGRSVDLGGGQALSFPDPGTRSVLDWYRRNKERWAPNVRPQDVEAIVDVVDEAPPDRPPGASALGKRTARILSVARIRAHRFAGLHAFHREGGPADVFVFEPSKPVTLLEGVNGSGKTSVANALMWCLTGHLIRSQRQPEPGTTEYRCDVERPDGKTSHFTSSVTPLPRGGDPVPEDGAALPADTWVEVTFADAAGTELPPVRRMQFRNARHKLVEEAPDLEMLGVDPLAFRIATLMPALIPHLSIGSPSQIGEAVARLTGLADLVDLSNHAAKVSKRLVRERVKELAAERDSFARRYREVADDLEGIVAKSPAMSLWDGLPPPSGTGAADRLARNAEYFVALKATALGAAREILGAGFDPADEADRNGLERDIGPAAEHVSRIKHLPSIGRLSKLSVEDEERRDALASLAEIERQASILSEMAGSPDRARRRQLYARVSSWMREHDHEGGTCPVCSRSLEGTTDPFSGAAVEDSLAEAERNGTFIAQTIAEWCEHWQGYLHRTLPDVLAAEARTTLPATPADLLRSGLVDEMFGAPSFAGVLSALRPGTEGLVDAQLAALPPFADPGRRILPERLQSHSASLQDTLDRLMRALAFADWRAANSAEIYNAILAVRDGRDGEPDADRAVGRRLSALRDIVRDADPLNAAIDRTARLEKARADFVIKERRIASCHRAAASLDALVPLGELAQAQVDHLRTKLQARTRDWRQAVFREATPQAPTHAGTHMDARGSFGLQAGREGVTAPAQHVSNASSLRATLLGFFLAFREHVLKTRGGLGVLCLDDPQEMLDDDNKERMARGLTLLAGSERNQLIVTTHDRKFARSLVAECRASDHVQHLSVHPVNAVCATVTLSPAFEEVDRKRQLFEKNPNSASHAREYASDLRVFIEARLGDLFDSATHPAHASPTRVATLNTHLDRLRGLVTAGVDEFFRQPAVKRFANEPALAERSEARRVLNDSHHAAKVGYADVLAVSKDLARLRSEVEAVHELFRRYRWREPLAPPEADGSSVAPFPAMPKPSFKVVLCPDLAAFSRGLPSGGSQDLFAGTVGGDWFEGKALSYVLRPTLGFAVPSGAVAIVDREAYLGRDQNLVVARWKGELMARRVVKSKGFQGVSLSAQMPDPRHSMPTRSFEEDKVQLHRIVGVVFTEMPPPDGAKGEAVTVDDVPELGDVEIAYRVREESAVPLVLPGQTVLGGRKLALDDLDRHRGRLVAVTLEDGTSVLKRVGSRLPGSLGHLRHFETVGSLGESLVAAVEQLEGTPDVSVVVSARAVVAVLYEGI